MDGASEYQDGGKGFDGEYKDPVVEGFGNGQSISGGDCAECAKK